MEANFWSAVLRSLLSVAIISQLNVKWFYKTTKINEESAITNYFTKRVSRLVKVFDFQSCNLGKPYSM
jgi:hypothetical protein